MKKTLTLCMIVKNEERLLEGCLSSAQPFVDEMIVVDTGSTDRTKEIAQKFGATIVDFPWINDFSAARNKALSCAQGEWILYLDADERIHADKSALVELLQNRQAFAFGCRVRGMHAMAEGSIMQENVYPRIFRNHPQIRFEGAVHEQITPSIQRLGKAILPSQVIVEHLGYAESWETVQKKCERNVEILREEVSKNRNNSYAAYQLGNTLSLLGRHAESTAELQRALSDSRLDPSLRASAHNILSDNALHAAAYDEALHQSAMSLKCAPDQSLARWLAITALIQSQQWTSALRELRSFEERTPCTGVRPAHDVVIEPVRIAAQQAYCYEKLGNLVELESSLHRLNDMKFFSYPLLKSALDLAMKSRSFEQALGFIELILLHKDQVPDEAAEKYAAIAERLTLLLEPHSA